MTSGDVFVMDNFFLNVYLQVEILISSAPQKMWNECPQCVPLVSTSRPMGSSDSSSREHRYRAMGNHTDSQRQPTLSLLRHTWA